MYGMCHFLGGSVAHVVSRQKEGKGWRETRLADIMCDEFK